MATTFANPVSTQKGITSPIPLQLSNFSANSSLTRSSTPIYLSMTSQPPNGATVQSFLGVSPYSISIPLSPPPLISPNSHGILLDQFSSQSPPLLQGTNPTISSDQASVALKTFSVPLTNQFVDSKRTTLVRIKRENGREVVSCEVYIGRAQNQGGWRLKASIFANPFSLKDYTLNESLRRYREHILGRSDLMAQLHLLKGKTLGCWCCNCAILPSDPSEYVCHGQILMELIRDRCK